MCRGSESVTTPEDTVQTPPKHSQETLQELQELEEDTDAGDLTPGSASSEPLAFPDVHPEPSDSEVTSLWCPPLPVRALQARLQPQNTPPRWAAWLPQRVHQASYGGAGQMSGAHTEMVSCESAPQMIPANAIYSHPVDMSQASTWVTPDGTILQPVFFYVEAGADESGWTVADSAWSDAGCYQYGGVQLEQEYVHEPVLQEAPGSIGPFAGRVWKLSQDSKGCRKMQDAFEYASDQERLTLASELKGHVWQALKCGNANHVLQKCITTMKPANVQFIINELTHNGTGGAAHAARHRFGCRVIERLLEHCSAEQLHPLVEELLADCDALSSHIYGYYCMQHLIEHLEPEVAIRISAALEQNLSRITPESYVGAVIGSALTKASNIGAQSLAAALLQDPERASSMACSRWGNSAVKHALQLVDVPLRDKACTELMWYSARLRSNRYGRLVVNAIAELQNTPITWKNRGGTNHMKNVPISKAQALGSASYDCLATATKAESAACAA